IRVETSPIEPWMLPIKASHHKSILPIYSVLVTACDSIVAPEKPSTAVHTCSPEIWAGNAKYKNARPVNAGFRKLRPVPPNTSLPITTPKVIPKATCHNGMVGGKVNANNTEVTKNPSLTSCLRTVANSTSQKPPTINVTAYTGIKKQAP